MPPIGRKVVEVVESGTFGVKACFYSLRPPDAISDVATLLIGCESLPRTRLIVVVDSVGDLDQKRQT